MRNLDPRNGLCNGTRLIVDDYSNRVLYCTIATGKHQGRKTIIPRIPLTSTPGDLPFILRRKQFPVRLAYFMTINKSQGQTMQTVGVHLPDAVFGHGQLYVALSRVGSPQSITVLVHDTQNQGTN